MRRVQFCWSTWSLRKLLQERRGVVSVGWAAAHSGVMQGCFGSECPLSLWRKYISSTVFQFSQFFLGFLNAEPDIMSRGGSKLDEWQLHLDSVTQTWHRFGWWTAKPFASRLNTQHVWFLPTMKDVLLLGMDTFANLVLLQSVLYMFPSKGAMMQLLQRIRTQSFLSHFSSSRLLALLDCGRWYLDPDQKVSNADEEVKLHRHRAD